jgi:hypothetical protein
MSSVSTSPADLARDGYRILPAVYSLQEVATIRAGIESTLACCAEDPAIRCGEGIVYAARNLLQLWPEARRVWQRSPLVDVLREELGPELGLVRVLYFDKPPGNTGRYPGTRI